MNIAEKSMEKTRFYNREDLKAKDVARLISIWEGEAGMSPLSVVYQRDLEYEKLMNKSNEIQG